MCFTPQQVSLCMVLVTVCLFEECGHTVCQYCGQQVKCHPTRLLITHLGTHKGSYRMQLYKTKNAIEFTLQLVFRFFHSGTQGQQQMPCSLPEMFFDLGPPGEALVVTLSLTPGRPLSLNMDPESEHCTAPEGSGTSGGEEI